MCLPESLQLGSGEIAAQGRGVPEQVTQLGGAGQNKQRRTMRAMLMCLLITYSTFTSLQGSILGAVWFQSLRERSDQLAEEVGTGYSFGINV